MTSGSTRRQFLHYAVLGSAATLLAACGQASPAAPTAAPAAPPKPTAAPAAAPTTAPTSAPAATSAPVAATGGAAPTGTLRYANADFNNESMDPIVIATQWGWALYDSLVTYDQRGNVVGDIAENYNLSPDGLTWTFNIRKGVKFHNGDPLTSADVVFSLQHFGFKESTNPWSPYIHKNNESNTATDDYTVVYKAQRPEWALKVPFAQVLILPKNYFTSVGQDGFRNKPIGTGPYKYVNHVPKASMEFEANTDYWGPAKPQWARIVEPWCPKRQLASRSFNVATST
jgi:ABC-type transport system substrate-binding protein